MENQMSPFFCMFLRVILLLLFKALIMSSILYQGYISGYYTQSYLTEGILILLHAKDERVLNDPSSPMYYQNSLRRIQYRYILN